MKKINIRLSLVALLMIMPVVFLAGCGKKEEKNKNNSVEQKIDQDQAIQNNEENSIRAENLKREDSPAEVINVCEGKVDGEDCEVAMPFIEPGATEPKKFPGICRKIRDSESVVCKAID